MNEEQFWQSILTKLEQREKGVLNIIINQTGSAPNSPGAKMFVTLEQAVGTVGGGLSEHSLINRSRTMIDEGISSPQKIHLVHSNKAEENRSGMICSGTQTFALIPLCESDSSTIKEIVKSYNMAQPGILTVNEKGISFSSGNTLPKDKIFFEQNSLWNYQENVGVQDSIFIIGGGHVSLALSRIMQTLGFHITVFDNRKDLPTMLANTYAHKKSVITYNNLESLIPEGDKTYVVIMTFAHKSDELVLEKLLTKKYRYIGMMASASKAETVFSNLEKKGVPKELLNKVHSPIGVDINSITPEEIAISISAEIIKIKNAER
ncbi:MAG: XdhC family protein [Candidatus Heimdallarchaeaceae archaeon]